MSLPEPSLLPSLVLTTLMSLPEPSYCCRWCGRRGCCRRCWAANWCCSRCWAAWGLGALGDLGDPPAAVDVDPDAPGIGRTYCVSTVAVPPTCDATGVPDAGAQVETVLWWIWKELLKWLNNISLNFLMNNFSGWELISQTLWITKTKDWFVNYETNDQLWKWITKDSIMCEIDKWLETKIVEKCAEHLFKGLSH